MQVIFALLLLYEFTILSNEGLFYTMAIVVEKPVDVKIKLLNTSGYLKYDPATASVCWVDIDPSAPVYEDKNAKAAVDIAAVIYRSGSMGEKETGSG